MSTSSSIIAASQRPTSPKAPAAFKLSFRGAYENSNTGRRGSDQEDSADVFYPHVNWLLEESKNQFKLNILIDYVLHQPFGRVKYI
jgi:hypothetical protein